MTRDEILKIFHETNALLHGHFLLTSGKHSDSYFQCARVLQYPEYAAKIISGLSDFINGLDFESVIAPAMGGLLVGYEVARQTGKRFIFAERENNEMKLRRGFDVSVGEKFLVCEDVVTTGGSVKEVIKIVEQSGGIVAGIISIVDRSNGNVQFAYPFKSALQMQVKTYEPANCPLCEADEPLIKPGSRKVF